MDKRFKTKKKPSRNRRHVSLLIVLAILLVGSVIMFWPPASSIKQGLDIQGGLSVVMSASKTDGSAVTSEDIDKSVSIIESRVNKLGASEATVQKQGSNQILIQIPGIDDPELALQTIGQTGFLEFVNVADITDEEVRTNIEDGQVNMELPEGSYTSIITGADISRVQVNSAGTTSAYYEVDITLNDTGKEAFAEVTTELAPTNGKLAIVLDGVVNSAPAVQSAITDGNVAITGNYSLEEAKSLQTVLESGSLPVSLEFSQSQVVGPTLGQDSLREGVFVALIGLLLVAIYLLVFYRGLGLLTAGAIGVFAVVYLGVLALLSYFGLFALSLAGIAGIVLAIGVAADSSILVLERFKEEIRMGRSVRASSITGVRHAIITSIDADLVTLVSALSLFFIAVGSVKGFGLTLALGVICDIVTMLLFKAPTIRLLAPKVIARHPEFWGIKEDEITAHASGELKRGVENA